MVQRPVADDDAGGMGRGMPVKAFQFPGYIYQLLDRRVVHGHFPELRFGLERLVQGQRVGGIERHQLADLIDIAVGHFQDPADVAEHGPGLQLSEGNDLGHVVAPVFFLDVMDHLVAAVLAEVDIEIRHRHPFRIEEAFEQEPEPQRIEIGDQ